MAEEETLLREWAALFGVDVPPPPPARVPVFARMAAMIDPAGSGSVVRPPRGEEAVTLVEQLAGHATPPLLARQRRERVVAVLQDQPAGRAFVQRWAPLWGRGPNLVTHLLPYWLHDDDDGYAL